MQQQRLEKAVFATSDRYLQTGQAVLHAVAWVSREVRDSGRKAAQ
jgi:hypothetical protein